MHSTDESISIAEVSGGCSVCRSILSTTITLIKIEEKLFCLKCIIDGSAPITMDELLELVSKNAVKKYHIWDVKN